MPGAGPQAAIARYRHGAPGDRRGAGGAPRGPCAARSAPAQSPRPLPLVECSHFHGGSGRCSGSGAALPRDARRARGHALPDPRARENEFRQRRHGALARWPQAGLHCQRRRWTVNAVGPAAGFPDRSGAAWNRRGGLSSLLVARRPLHRLRRAGKAQEGRGRGRPGANAVRTPRQHPWRVVEPRRGHYLRLQRNRPLPGVPGRRRAHPADHIR